MSTWTIPVVVSDVQATPHPQAPSPGWPNRNFGLIGILTISTDNTGAYQGIMLFNKPASFFAKQSYGIATQYITGSPVLTITIPQAASDCQAKFSQNGNLNPHSANPPLFNTATVNSNGRFTAGNLSLPDFTLKGTWDNSQNVITNGEIWLPYRFLWAIWGNTPSQSQTPWGQFKMSFGSQGASSTNATVFYLDTPPSTPIWGANGLQLNVNDAVIVGVNTSLQATQGIALNISCFQNSAPLSVSISTDKTEWGAVPAGFDVSVKQQCFFIPPNLIPSTKPFYLQIQNQTGASVVVSAAQLLY